MSLQYLKGKVKDEIDFCTGKNESFQQTCTIKFDGCS